MMANPVFSHLTVLELAQGVSGPYATIQLADFGARVIKIEPPQGDWSRAMGPAVRGRGKRVGFGSESQQRKHGCRSHPNRESRRVSRLVAMADVVVIDMLPVERQAYYLQTSLMAANLALQATRIAEYHAGGQQPPRMGHAISYHVPHQTFATQTHWIAVAVHTATQCHF